MTIKNQLLQSKGFVLETYLKTEGLQVLGGYP